MKVLVTGAGGFIGATLMQLLQQVGQIGTQRITQLAAMDRQLPPWSDEIVCIEGELQDAAVQERIARFGADLCFHLAAVPGGAAEADPALSRRVNLDATLDLFEVLAARPAAAAPVVVYASTIAVYGTLPDPVSPSTPTRPALVYGAHKRACEILLADATRRGRLDGRSLRLPGIVARPRVASGLVSAFMSELLHGLAGGASVTLPVGPRATAWWMSAQCCAENLLHAASMDPTLDTEGHRERCWPLPVLRLSMGELVQTLSTLYGVDGRALVHYAPQEEVEAVFGRYPVLDDRIARQLGLRDDGDAETLVRRALAPYRL
ncbi:NAD-dependent epimerase/dehydratase family protein [Herbaspirillum sp. AP02]|uniref:NAD-dependent epimerase/dehydratase family protein n=1 Tax=unclassified Herbaspirillum TaxID=2624150 RepID=UPI0015DA096B|nr:MULTISPECIES: NAD-dependent epimerase/dehydratase family protein [unclassified Herbaspirillum]MBG7619470.1 NAD-dependent epimerase/dehydratase family protein [Herbaspirillum sp. AP02]NZD66754.1 NAD-dependent epimerase/dehydratase family protein [Herbaspirillum sp. AP21]